jgi:hypothetical protein
MDRKETLLVANDYVVAIVQQKIIITVAPKQT